METLSPVIPSIHELCKLNGVRSLFAFGSVLTDRFNSESDLDLIVELNEKDPIEYTEKYFNLKFGLENLFGPSVVLLEEWADLNPMVRRGIERSKIVVYEC